MMSSLTMVLLFLSISFSKADTIWKVDPSNSSIVFCVSHMVISEAVGRFAEFSGTLTQTKDDFSDSIAEINIVAQSINTDNTNRDNHLRSDDFFAVDTYPTVTFKSTSFNEVSNDHYEIHGDLTMRGVTKPVVFKGQLTGILTTARGSAMGFKATATIDRYDFGLRWNSILEGGGLNVGKEVAIEVRFELRKQ